MHRSRERRQVQQSAFPHGPSWNIGSNKVRDGGTRAVSPDPVRHAKALVESFGATTALQIAQVNAQLTGSSRCYWTEVLDHVVDAWGRR
jgi:hypothetical protein